MSLLKIRTLFLLFYGTLGSCLPYFPVYYRAIGLDPDFIGLLGSITPAITFVVSPLWGALADSTGAYRGIILLTFVLSVIGRCVSIHSIFTKNILLMGLLVAVTAVLNAPVKVTTSSPVHLRPNHSHNTNPNHHHHHHHHYHYHPSLSWTQPSWPP